MALFEFNPFEEDRTQPSVSDFYEPVQDEIPAMEVAVSDQERAEQRFLDQFSKRRRERTQTSAPESIQVPYPHLFQFSEGSALGSTTPSATSSPPTPGRTGSDRHSGERMAARPARPPGTLGPNISIHSPGHGYRHGGGNRRKPTYIFNPSRDFLNSYFTRDVWGNKSVNAKHAFTNAYRKELQKILKQNGIEVYTRDAGGNRIINPHIYDHDTGTWKFDAVGTMEGAGNFGSLIKGAFENVKRHADEHRARLQGGGGGAAAPAGGGGAAAPEGERVPTFFDTRFTELNATTHPETRLARRGEIPWLDEASGSGTSPLTHAEGLEKYYYAIGHQGGRPPELRDSIFGGKTYLPEHVERSLGSVKAGHTTWMGSPHTVGARSRQRTRSSRRHGGVRIAGDGPAYSRDQYKDAAPWSWMPGYAPGRAIRRGT